MSVSNEPVSLAPTACHILECCDGLAQEVIGSIGQAFELRFKQYLQCPSKIPALHDRWVALWHRLQWPLCIFWPFLLKTLKRRKPHNYLPEECSAQTQLIPGLPGPGDTWLVLGHGSGNWQMEADIWAMLPMFRKTFSWNYSDSSQGYKKKNIVICFCSVSPASTWCFHMLPPWVGVTTGSTCPIVLVLRVSQSPDSEAPFVRHSAWNGEHWFCFIGFHSFQTWWPVWSWASSLTSLGLSSFLCKIGIMVAWQYFKC